jgi:hypothetical protein
MLKYRFLGLAPDSLKLGVGLRICFLIRLPNDFAEDNPKI